MLKSSTLLLLVLSMTLLGCGGGGGGGDKSTNSSGTSTPSTVTNVAYTEPTPNGGQPVIRFNSTLSTSSVLVFDVAGTSTTLTRGLNLNVRVDNTKLLPVDVPGAASAAVRPAVGTGIDTGGFGAGAAAAVRQDKNDGTALMVTALRNPSPALPSNTVLMRFAYKLNGNPVAGVVRMEVLTGSGLFDGRGRILDGTSPAVGRLEIKA